MLPICASPGNLASCAGPHAPRTRCPFLEQVAFKLYSKVIYLYWTMSKSASQDSLRQTVELPLSSSIIITYRSRLRYSILLPLIAIRSCSIPLSSPATPHSLIFSITINRIESTFAQTANVIKERWTGREICPYGRTKAVIAKSECAQQNAQEIALRYVSKALNFSRYVD